ncbi:MAG: SDR family oxidoreductase [Candidatus Cryptobacteroides sp.]
MIILVTGVSSGFGRAVARALADRGHEVYGTVRREVEPLEGVTYVYADVRDDAQVSEAFGKVMEMTGGKLDVFINNAGMGIGGPLEYCKAEDVREQMDVNFLGMVRWMPGVVGAMRRQGYGRIICISSIGGLMGLPYQGAYSASKFAVEGYCEALRLELRKSGVDVVVVEPGDFSTGFTATRRSVDVREASAAYPSYGKSLRGIEADERNGLKPEYLARKICGIVEKKHPSPSYVVASPLQRLSVFAKWLLPARLFQWVLSLYYGV